MTLLVEVRHRQDEFILDAAFRCGGALTALFGASGSGKTSLIQAIAGLLRPETARIEVDGKVLVDTAKGIFVPTHKRRIGYVFQDARLFPHLTVAQNLRYGRAFVPKRERYAPFDDVVDLLGIGALMDRRPSGLSGGEKQRVAIGRALIASPRLVLMDEPLASLDEARKAEVLPYIERLRDESRIPIVYVSHSVAEVARLATDIVVVVAGKVQSYGPANEILSRHDLLPDESREEAGALVDLEVVAPDDGFGLTLLRSPAGEWRLPRVDAPVGAHRRARVRARDVMIATEAPRNISALNVLAGVVIDIRQNEGPDVLLSLRCGGDRLVARVTRRSVENLALEPGRAVFAVVKAVTFEKGNTAFTQPKRPV